MYECIFTYIQVFSSLKQCISCHNIAMHVGALNRSTPKTQSTTNYD